MSRISVSPDTLFYVSIGTFVCFENKENGLRCRGMVVDLGSTEETPAYLMVATPNGKEYMVTQYEAMELLE